MACRHRRGGHASLNDLPRRGLPGFLRPNGADETTTSTAAWSSAYGPARRDGRRRAAPGSRSAHLVGAIVEYLLYRPRDRARQISAPAVPATASIDQHVWTPRWPKGGSLTPRLRKFSTSLRMKAAGNRGALLKELLLNPPTSTGPRRHARTEASSSRLGKRRAFVPVISSRNPVEDQADVYLVGGDPPRQRSSQEGRWTWRWARPAYLIQVRTPDETAKAVLDRGGSASRQSPSPGSASSSISSAAAISSALYQAKSP